MATEIERIEKEIHSLSTTEKAYLVRSLIEDLDDVEDTASEKLWAEEAARRFKSYRDGKIKVVPGDEAMQRVRQRLK